MQENENEVIDSTTGAETTENNEEIELNLEEADEETITIPKKEYTTIIAQKDHWKKKAGESKEEPKPESRPAGKSELSQFDVITLAKANLEDEDMNEVIEYAKFKNIPISQALNSSVVRASISERAEQKKIASATNTSGSTRGTSRISDDSLRNKASKGELPDSDEEIRRLNNLRWGKKS